MLNFKACKTLFISIVPFRSREDIAELRMSLHGIKEVLSNKRGSQANLHELWLRRKLLQEQLRLVNEIHILRDSPIKIETLIRQKYFLAAVNLFNLCMKTMFGEVRGGNVCLGVC